MAKILAIDDDLEILRIIQKHFHRAGHEVDTASSGREGIDRVRLKAPDLVITDLMMPDGDGHSVVEAIRTDGALTLTPIIMLTARCDVEDVVRGLEKGADDYLSKPFMLQELLARANALIRMRDLQGQALETERLKALLEMAGAAAHEINQPLTVIMGYADLLVRRTTADDPSRPLLGAIVENAAQIADILKKLQAIRRYESKTYLGDIKILDVERSTKEDEQNG